MPKAIIEIIRAPSIYGTEFQYEKLECGHYVPILSHTKRKFKRRCLECETGSPKQPPISKDWLKENQS